MAHILDITAPFFALVLLGWVAARHRWLPADGVPALNAFVLYFALPCMLFRFAADTPVTRLFDARIAGLWLLCALAVVAVAMALAHRAGVRGPDAALGALTAAFSNSGFMGVPLLVELLGARAAAPAIVTLVVDMVVTSSLCIGLAQLARGGEGGVGPAVGRALRGMAVNPLPWAIAAGGALSASGLQLPHVLLKPVSMLADAASPAALFTLGAMLARSARRRLAGEGQPRPGDRAGLVAIKLLVHPLLVYGAARVALALGAPLDPFTARVLVLVAALPSASNVPMLAERCGADSGRLAQAVLLSTVAAFGSFAAVAGWLTG